MQTTEYFITIVAPKRYTFIHITNFTFHWNPILTLWIDFTIIALLSHLKVCFQYPAVHKIKIWRIAYGWLDN